MLLFLFPAIQTSLDKVFQILLMIQSGGTKIPGNIDSITE